MKKWLAIGGIISLAFVGDGPQRPAPFLKAGNEIVYSAVAKVDPERTERDRMVIRIKSVDVLGSHIAAHAMLAVYKKDNEINALYYMNFACDSLNYYVDATNWAYQSVDPIEVKYEYKGDSLIYPLNMKSGDSLPDAYATKRWQSEYGSGEQTIEFTRRTVTALDTLDLAFGKTTAWRIEFNMRMYESKRSDKDQNYLVTEWFSPSIGIVKTDYQLGKGRAVMVMESYTH